MRELPLAVQLVGHPIVASILNGLLVLGFLFLLSAGPEGLMGGLLLLVPAIWVTRAAEAVKRERDWQRAWDSMTPPGSAPPSSRQAIGWTVVAVLIGLYIWAGG